MECKDKMRECDICGKKMSHIYNLRKHMVDVHKDYRYHKYKCACGTAFISYPASQAHAVKCGLGETVNYIVQRDLPGECDVCGKAFVRKSSIQQHKRNSCSGAPENKSETRSRETVTKLIDELMELRGRKEGLDYRIDVIMEELRGKCTDAAALDARIEVKTVLPSAGIQSGVQQAFLVDWKPCGEAEFHVDCWQRLLVLSRSRKQKRSSKDDIIMTKEEKALVKAAAEAPEQFDGVDTVLHEAARAALWINSAEHCVAFTGAGISTSAGIGDYRGKAGKWTAEDQSHGLDMNSVFDPATGATGGEPASKRARVDPATSGDVSDDSDDDEGVPYEKLRPTYTHEALVKLLVSGHLKYVISQNGDGLHGLSGIPKENISELHGNVFVEMCEACGARYDRKYYVMDDIGSQYYEEIEDYGKSDVKKPKHAKKCDLCGLSHRTGRKCQEKSCRGQLKDTIINFRDLLEETILERAWDNSRRCDVMLCLGTTLQVTPASDLVKKVKDRNKLIICNRQETPVDGQFDRKGPDGEMKGSRVFGDCDVFMREVMKNIYSSDDLAAWELGRNNRLKAYDKQRD